MSKKVEFSNLKLSLTTLIVGSILIGVGVTWGLIKSPPSIWVILLTQGINFVLGAIVLAVVIIAGQTYPVDRPTNPSEFSTGTSSPKLAYSGSCDELRLKHCAIMMGIGHTESVTYLIPCVGTPSRPNEVLPAGLFDTILDSADQLRSTGLAVKVLIPSSIRINTPYVPLVSKYVVGLKHFPVPKAFFSGN